MPEKDPHEGKQTWPCPWPKALSIVNTKKVADFWCGGDGERAKALPRSTFNEVLAVAIAQEQGRAIEAENDAKAQESKARLTALQNANK